MKKDNYHDISRFLEKHEEKQSIINRKLRQFLFKKPYKKMKFYERDFNGIILSIKRMINITFKNDNIYNGHIKSIFKKIDQLTFEDLFDILLHNIYLQDAVSFHLDEKKIFNLIIEEQKNLYKIKILKERQRILLEHWKYHYDYQ